MLKIEWDFGWFIMDFIMDFIRFIATPINPPNNLGLFEVILYFPKRKYTIWGIYRGYLSFLGTP